MLIDVTLYFICTTYWFFRLPLPSKKRNSFCLKALSFRGVPDQSSVLTIAKVGSLSEMIARLDLMSLNPVLGNPRVASARTSAVEQASKALEKSLLTAYATQILLKSPGVSFDGFISAISPSALSIFIVWRDLKAINPSNILKESAAETVPASERSRAKIMPVVRVLEVFILLPHLMVKDSES